MGNTQSRSFAEITQNSTKSSLNNRYYVNEKTGVSAICKVNLVHTVILFEYLLRTEGILQRAMIQVDFGPDNKRSCAVRKGNAQHQEFIGKNEILANIRNLKVGKNWLCNTAKLLKTFADIKNEIFDCATTNISPYSSPSIRANVETENNNCLAFVVDLLDRKASDLGIILDRTQVLKTLPHPDLWVTVWSKRDQSFKV